MERRNQKSVRYALLRSAVLSARRRRAYRVITWIPATT